MAVPVIAMTITLAAVYAPIGFVSGLSGALFKEFVVTLAGAVLVSGVIALTLSPMLCAKLLLARRKEEGLAKRMEFFFAKLKDYYQNVLHQLLEIRSMILILASVVLLMIPYLYTHTKTELVPKEDLGSLTVWFNAPKHLTLDYIQTYMKELDKVYASIPDIRYYVSRIIPSNTTSEITLKPWNQRTTSMAEIQRQLQNHLSQIAGLSAYISPMAPLSGVGGVGQVNFVILSSEDVETLSANAEKLVALADKSQLFSSVITNLEISQPGVELQIDRAKAAAMGIDVRTIANNIAPALSGRNVNNFNLQGRNYQVIIQLDRQFRLTPELIGQIYLPTSKGGMVPLLAVTKQKEKVSQSNINHFQQLNAVTLYATLMPGKTQGEGVAFLNAAADKLLPKGLSYDYAGETRQFLEESTTLLNTLLVALIVIFLVLAVQYDSFRDPFIILVSVPMSLCGALIPLNLGMASINIYTQIGLITLIGLISKHGILIVDFANRLQQEKQLDKQGAVEEAAAIRLRPILMTTAAMVFGVLPLLFGHGPGSKMAFDIAIVISSGLIFGTAFTLFVIPAIYTYLSADHREDIKS